MHTAGPQPTALQQGTVFYFKAGCRVALQQSSEFFSSFGVAAATLSNHHAKITLTILQASNQVLFTQLWPLHPFAVVLLCDFLWMVYPKLQLQTGKDTSLVCSVAT
jgi:hypothetical protein